MKVILWGVFFTVLLSAEKTCAHIVLNKADLWFEDFKRHFNESLLDIMVESNHLAHVLNSLESDSQNPRIASTEFSFLKKKEELDSSDENDQVENQKVLNILQDALCMISDKSSINFKTHNNQEQEKVNNLGMEPPTMRKAFLNSMQTIENGIFTKFENSQLNMFVSQFFWEATSKIVNIKKQIQGSKLVKNKTKEEAYKKKMSTYLAHVITAAKEISSFKPEKISTEEINSFDLISYSKEDEKFLGNLIGMIICKNIKPLMDDGNVSAASQEAVNVLNDIATYLGFVTITIGLCTTFIAPLPLLCWASVASVGVASLALMLRIIKNR
ncbi:hypothetical protein ACO0RG_004176 [Hanseniaspora osmophila]|uniref:Uncharacterized protein n=1 Tax=Hanseniaspora osmophila TaxID=56408 RepID=A0A1E5RAK4_9ASCO|nr:hypothetical protein AWRI3579_g2800 [Hanseniaspora osmophila]